MFRLYCRGIVPNSPLSFSEVQLIRMQADRPKTICAVAFPPACDYPAVSYKMYFPLANISVPNDYPEGISYPSYLYTITDGTGYEYSSGIMSLSAVNTLKMKIVPLSVGYYYLTLSYSSASTTSSTVFPIIVCK